MFALPTIGGALMTSLGAGTCRAAARRDADETEVRDGAHRRGFLGWGRDDASELGCDLDLCGRAAGEPAAGEHTTAQRSARHQATADSAERGSGHQGRAAGEQRAAAERRTARQGRPADRSTADRSKDAARARRRRRRTAPACCRGNRLERGRRLTGGAADDPDVARGRRRRARRRRRPYRRRLVTRFWKNVEICSCDATAVSACAIVASAGEIASRVAAVVPSTS